MRLPFRKKKKKKKSAPVAPEVPEAELGERVLPSELEKFKLKGPFEETLSGKTPETDLGKPLMPPRLSPAEPAKPEKKPRAGAESDRIELIISKLDTIDARLRVIEEKLKR